MGGEQEITVAAHGEPGPVRQTVQGLRSFEGASVQLLHSHAGSTLRASEKIPLRALSTVGDAWHGTCFGACAQDERPDRVGVERRLETSIDQRENNENRHPIEERKTLLDQAPRGSRDGTRAFGSRRRLHALLHEHHISSSRRGIGMPVTGFGNLVAQPPAIDDNKHLATDQQGATYARDL